MADGADWGTPPPPPPPPSGPPRPSRAGYAIAAVIAVVGAVIAIVGVVNSFRTFADRVDAFQRVNAPGTGQVTFAEAGDFTLYYEAPGVSGDGGVVPAMDIVLVAAPAGPPVQLSRYGGRFTYTVSGHEGTAIATFHIGSPGRYVLTSTADSARLFGQLAVGKSLGSALAGLLVPILLAFAAFGTAAVLAIVTAVKRSRRRSG